MSARPAGQRATDLVVALGAANCALIVVVSGVLGRAVSQSVFGAGPSAVLVLVLLSGGFLVVALVVTTAVTANAFAVLVAGQVRDIALRRLLGSPVLTERRRIVRGGVRRALPAVAVGALAGHLLAVAVVLAFVVSPDAALVVEPTELLPPPSLLVPLFALVLCVRQAAWRGSARVLEVQPVEALRTAAETETGDGAEPGDRSRRAARTALRAGVALCLLSAVAGAVTPLAVVGALVGGTLSIIGVIALADGLVPWWVRLAARLLPRSPQVEVAARTLLAHPVRTARAALGVALAVAVVVMFAVATATFQAPVTGHYVGTALAGEATAVVATVTAVVTAMTGLTALTAAVGLATAIAASTRLRRREIALARVLGQSAALARRTITAESALLSLAASLLGLVLGTAYGWLGAQATLASVLGLPLLVPVVPLGLVVAVLGVALALTVAAATAPAREVLRRAPIRAFSDA